MPDAPSTPTTRIGFLLLPQYSMIAFANAVEVLRMANRVSSRPLYEWRVCGAAGERTACSNGLVVHAAASLADLDACDIVFVCGGIDVSAGTTEAVRRDLRRRAAAQQVLGAICTGAYALASAGALDGYRCAVHWENYSALSDAFPRVRFVQDIFIVDRDRFSSSGGTAPLHLMLHLVGQHHGKRLPMDISAQFIVDRVRASGDRQRQPQPACIGPGYQHLAAAMEIMENNVEDPLPLSELAAAVKISLRQLERMFQRYNGMGPAQYYLNVRLRRARDLLTTSSLPIMQITVACGFQSSSHFCKAYRALFGMAPSDLRRREAARPRQVAPVVHLIAA
jgi:transcriptional regulator GlxA family with amidase domain